MPLIPDTFYETIRTGWFCLCPKCNKTSIYTSRFGFTLKDKCEDCGLKISENDSGDGPAVFLIFILGFLLTPIALIVAMNVTWPLWLHGIIWTVFALALTLGSLRPLKAYIIALQYKHRPDDWN